MMLRKFGIVKLWIGIKTAEDECIERIKKSALNIGVECVVVDSMGRGIIDKEFVVNKKNVDFVIHLHFDTPKSYDAFSFVALWNPLEYYFVWGFERTISNLLSHDDFLSCGSNVFDEFISGYITESSNHLVPYFKLHHSLPKVEYLPSKKKNKLFYCGINWERISSSKGRHEKILQYLDKLNLVDIYGPRIFLGVNVWRGFKGYKGEIEFDGTSLLKYINETGICLVISSQEHKESQISSNRLFEAISAGVLVISDENQFCIRHFGNSLLYIDMSKPIEKIGKQIEEHIKWASLNTEKVISMITKAQAIFNEKFSLNLNLNRMYENLEFRKKMLSKLDNKITNLKIISIYFIVDNDSVNIERSLIGLLSQSYEKIEITIVLPNDISKQLKKSIEKILNEYNNIKKIIKILELDYIDNYISKQRRNIGDIILELIDKEPKDQYINITTTNEVYYSNHIEALVNGIEDKGSFDLVISSLIPVYNDEIINKVYYKLNLDDLEAMTLGRFLIKPNKIKKNNNLKHLCKTSMLLLICGLKYKFLYTATVTAYMKEAINMQLIKNQKLENKILQMAYDNESITFKDNFYNPQLVGNQVINNQYIKLSEINFNYGWIKNQIKLILKEGVVKRFSILNRKIKIIK